MNLEINICTNHSCKVIVKESKGDYLPEDSTIAAKNRFKFSDTVSIDLLQHNKCTGTELQNPIITIRKNNISDIELPVNFDGWFTVLHLVIPSKDWLISEINKESGSTLELYDCVYYSDGDNIYKYINGESYLVDINELVNRNIENTTISKTCENYVSICFLNKCYISLCQKILNDRTLKYCSECTNKNNTDSDLIFRRDYVWMALNVIRYLVQFEQLAEAERVIEKVSGCNGLCKSEWNSITTNGCGCRN